MRDDLDAGIVAAQIKAQDPQVGVEICLSLDTLPDPRGFGTYQSALENQAGIVRAAGHGCRREQRRCSVEVIYFDEHLSGDWIATPRNNAHVA
jgi:hypothetical protein